MRVLAVIAVATCPALALGGCVAVLLGTEPSAWRLGLAGHPAAAAAVALVAVVAVAMGGSLRRLAGGLWHTRRFRDWVAARETPVVGRVPAVAAEVGLTGRLRVVAAAGQLAVTAGLARPYVVVSTGLVSGLPEPELRAVLAHEQAHLRWRDPLRLLVVRLLAAHLWFLPVARDLRGRALASAELAADRHAAARFGRSALAGALLRASSAAAGAAALGPGAASGTVVTGFADPLLLERRVAQLESGRAPRPAPVAPARAALTAVAAIGFLAAVAGAWVFMLLTCPGEMGLAAAGG